MEPQYYNIAAEVYDRNKARIHTAAVVNTAKLKTDLQAEDNTLASVVQSENLYARAYVCYLLGRVAMCESVSQLKEHKIAITASCMLYQGNALRKMNPEIYRMPYIGKYALAQQLKLKEAEYEEKSRAKSELDAQIKKKNEILDALRNCNFEMLKEEQGDDVIREYTDYRSYLDFDIEIVSRDGKVQKFSKIYREKSGGETQTPYYVAIAASFVQLYSMGETRATAFTFCLYIGK